MRGEVALARSEEGRVQPGNVAASGPAVAAGDIAEHQQIVEPGPNPLLRAVLGLLLGAVTGAVTVALTARPEPKAPLTAAGARDRGR